MLLEGQMLVNNIRILLVWIYILGIVLQCHLLQSLLMDRIHLTIFVHYIQNQIILFLNILMLIFLHSFVIIFIYSSKVIQYQVNFNYQIHKNEQIMEYVDDVVMIQVGYLMMGIWMDSSVIIVVVFTLLILLMILYIL